MSAIGRALSRVASSLTGRGGRPVGAEHRFYDAGRPSRSTALWRRPFTSARSETYAALPYLRASSHDIVRNNPHGAKIIADLAKDIIGTGIMPRADTGNEALNKKVDEVAAKFFANIDADGITKNYAGFQTLAARTMLEGGEAVFRRYIRPTRVASRLGLKVPLQFALMEGELIDNFKNTLLPGGNRIVQGIEFNPEDRTREAYWMFLEHPGDTYMGSVEGAFQAVRVPAEDVQVMYEPQRAGQIRGVPWITPILIRAKKLDDYEDAERDRKKTESSVPLIVKAANQMGEASDNTGPSLFPTMTDADGRVVEVVQAGMVAYTRDSAGVEALTPSDSTSYAPYKRSELQSIAAGARSTYELASGDLSQTSFSSIQFGTLNYRGMVDALRAIHFIPVFEWFWRCMIDVSMIVGELPPKTPYGVKHHCPPWLPIDPDKQASANKTMMRTGEKSFYEVVTAGGKDFEEHVAEIAKSSKLLDKFGLILDSDPRRTDLRGVNQQVAAETKGNVPAPPKDDPDQD